MRVREIWLCVVALVGCGFQPATEADLQEAVESTEAAVLFAGDRVATEEWNSGRTQRLSSWQTVNCGDIDSEAWVTGVRAWREPSRNADNFMAKIDVECTPYGLVRRGGDVFRERTGTTTAQNLFTADHQSSNSHAGITASSEHFITAMVVTGRNVAKGFMLYSSDVTHHPVDGDLLNAPSDNVGVVGVAPGFNDLTLLSCPAQHALQGLSVRFDTRSGKVRRLRMHCRRLVDEPDPLPIIRPIDFRFTTPKL